MSLLLAAHIAWANMRRTIYNSVLPLKGLSADEAAHVAQLKQWVADNRAAANPAPTGYGASWVDANGITWRRDRFGLQRVGAL